MFLVFYSWKVITKFFLSIFNFRNLKVRRTVKSTSKDDLKEKNVNKKEESCKSISNIQPPLTLKIKGLNTKEFKIVKVSLLRIT